MDSFTNLTVEQVSDGELVRLLLAGDQQAMEVIFDRYYRLLMGVALRILRDPARAEDVIQIVFTEFYEKAHLFDETRGNLRTWLLQYAYGRSFNEKKRLKGRQGAEQSEVDRLDERSEEPASRLNLGKQETARYVDEILDQLSEKQRLVIQKVFFEDMDISEVASRTGQSLGNVYHAYYRGLDKLRKLVAGPESSSLRRKENSERQDTWLRTKRKEAQRLTGEVESVKTRTL
jgi:RNA polymerase sigma-70 factor (ECF subfamily)